MLDLTREAGRHALAIPPPPGALAPAVIATWRGRMINEHGSARVFDALADQLARLGDADAAAECRAFADEERTHGALCGAVVVAAGGDAVAPELPGRALPEHADATPAAAVARNVISICCLSETVAVALIGAERLELPDGPLRELLTKIWADEIGHARFGWRYLSRVAPLDASVAGYLPVALRALEQHELAHLPPRTWPREGSAYGLCDGADARALFYDTVEDVILPQLDALGLPAIEAWRTR